MSVTSAGPVALRSLPALATGGLLTGGRVPPSPLPSPSCMALRMSPLSASISQANRPPSWLASTYCPLALTERSLSKLMSSPVLALKT
ncbi:hypothetical protein D3C80_1164680 [compost metagenome]